jgi:hypothetical protein
VSFDEPTCKRYMAEKHSLCCEHRVDKEMAALERANIELFDDHVRHELRYRMESYIHAMPTKRIEVHHRWPKTWWDAFKERWFPGWANRYWPIEYNRIDVSEQQYVMCPHLQIDSTQRHLQWMAMTYDGLKA